MENQKQLRWSVKEWMTKNPKIIAPNCSAKQAFILMKKDRIRHLLVARDKKLLGIISDRDLRRPESMDDGQELDYFYRLDDAYQVEFIMTKKVQTVSEDDYIGTALQIFIEHRFGAIPVVNDRQEIAGILSVYDVLRAFSNTLEGIVDVSVPDVTKEEFLDFYNKFIKGSD